jgi:peptidoglycan-associated lipoprotein
MSRHVFRIAAIGVALLGCAHKQKVASETRAPERPKPRPLAVAEPPRQDGEAAIFFDFDSALLRDDARPVLQRIAEDVAARNAALTIEGNCDEVGTIEYNLALGEHRAVAAKEYLVHMGVPPGQIATVSYGAQRPRYPGHDAEARARNRRDDLVVSRMGGPGPVRR